MDYFVLAISVEPKDKDKQGESGGSVNQSFILKYNQSEAKDVIEHILVQYDDYTFGAKYKLFLKISGIALSYNEFGILHDEIKKDLAKNFVDRNALLEYHVDHVMAREHTDMVKALVKEWKMYLSEWEKTAYRNDPDTKKLSRLSRLMHETMKLLSEFNLGTNVILFIQKKMEMLENKTKSLNIVDLNSADKYVETNNIDNKVNDLSLPPEAATTTTSEADEEKRRSENARVIPKVRSDQSGDVQGSVLPSPEVGSGGEQTETTERARGAVF